jgi:hypothetical protein
MAPELEDGIPACGCPVLERQLSAGYPAILREIV